MLIGGQVLERLHQPAHLVGMVQERFLVGERQQEDLLHQVLRPLPLIYQPVGQGEDETPLRLV